MSTRTYRVTHRTSYRYGATMTDGYSVACLVPRPTDHQVVHESQVMLVPAASEWDSYLDSFGNLINQFGLHEPHTEMTVEAVSVVEVTQRRAPIDDTPWEQVVEMVSTAEGDLAIEVGLFRSSSTFVDIARLGTALGPIATDAFPAARSIVDAVRALCMHIFEEFEFDPHFSTVATPLDAVLAAGRGVCQDFAHLMIGMLRSVGIPARYVSGYLFAADETAIGPSDVPVRVQTHAWVDAAIPGHGWLPADPTNAQPVGERHVVIGHGRDYDDVAPVRGVYVGSAVPEVDSIVEIRRMEQIDRVMSDRPRRRGPLVPPPLPEVPDAQTAQQQQQQQQQQ